MCHVEESVDLIKLHVVRADVCRVVLRQRPSIGQGVSRGAITVGAMVKTSGATVGPSRRSRTAGP